MQSRSIAIRFKVTGRDLINEYKGKYVEGKPENHYPNG
jgi:hypothetical protein